MDYDRCKYIEHQKVKNLVAENGWTTVYCPEVDGYPKYGYTVGLFEKYNHPEIIIFGVNHRKCIETFYHITFLIEHENKRMVPLEYNYDILEDLPVMFCEMGLIASWDYLELANYYYEDKTLIYPAMQMIWPDRYGVFPWDEKYDFRLKGNQSLISNYEEGMNNEEASDNKK